MPTHYCKLLQVLLRSPHEVRLCWEVQGCPCLRASHCEREEEGMEPGALYKVTNFVVEQPSELGAKE